MRMRNSTGRYTRLSLLTGVLVLQIAGCTDATVGPAALSDISIGVVVSGVDTNESFFVALDGRASQPLDGAGGLVFRSVASGRHTIALSGFRENCSLEGSNPVVLDLPPGGVTRVDFAVTCTATVGVIAVGVQVSGPDMPVWFRLQVDSAPPSWIRGNQTAVLGSFARGAHVVRLVEAPFFCNVLGDDSTLISLTTGGLTQDTVLANFAVGCEAGTGNTSADEVIAFQRGDYIALVHEDGSNTRLLTVGESPSWAPRREFLAFQRPRCVPEGCSNDLWMVRPDGSGARELTRSESFSDGDPAVSPDGGRVALIRFWLGPDQSYLVVADLTGMSPVILSIWDPISTPAWSPDGNRIAFTCEPRLRHAGLDLCVVTTAGGCTSYFVNECPGLPTVVRLTDSRLVESDPAWSPDGKRIAFTLACPGAPCPAGVESRETYIALIDPVTRAVTTMASGHSPAWSPDGKHIVFAGNAGNPGLSVMDIDGTGLRKLTDDPRDAAPSWR